MKYKTDTATSKEIKRHLKATGMPYGDDYVHKIKDSAYKFEAWDGELVGLLAVYERGYITNLSVAKGHRRRGIATKLLKIASEKFSSFELETNNMDFWLSRGFKVRMYR